MSTIKTFPHWISTDEAVEISGYNCAHLRRLLRSGQVRAEEKGGAWWVDCDALKSFVAETAESPDGRRGGRSQTKPLPAFKAKYR